jgi:sugar lactone lactonase YvrE
MATDGAPCAKKARPGGLDAVVSSLALPALGDAMWLAVDPCDGISFFVCTHYAIMTVSPTGVISLLAGGKQGFVDGQGRDARFNIPRGIAVDKDGNLLVADCNNHAIRKVTRTGLVTTVAGNGQAGFADGLGAAARFSHPFGVALDRDGMLLVSDFNNNTIRKVSPSGAVTTIAGNGEIGFADGQGAEARFNAPHGIAVDKDGIIYVCDSHNHAIRKVVPGRTHNREAVVTTLAGAREPGFADGVGAAARFDRPAGIAVDAHKTVIVSDSKNHRLPPSERTGGREVWWRRLRGGW